MRTLLILLLSTTSTTILHAQTTSTPSGAHVRVVTRGYPIAEGTLVRLSRDSVVLADSTQRTVNHRFAGWQHRERAFAVGSGTTLERQTGTRSHAGTGAVVGGVVGFLAGAVVAGALGSDPDAGGGAGSSNETAFLGGVLFGLAGAGLGAMTGASMRVPVWEPVAVPDAALALVSPAPRSVAIAIRLGF